MQKEKLKGKFILAFDTLCTGWEAVRDENHHPVLCNSIEEAELDRFDKEDFVIPAEEFIEGRKAIFTGNGGHVIGNKDWYKNL
jgi:hypothetical protein